MAESESLGQKVTLMRNQGLKDNQIMQSLQKEGKTSQEILNAFDVADHAKTFRAQVSPAPVSNPMTNEPKSVAGPPPFNKQPTPIVEAPKETKPDEDIEELIEAIIDEKWSSLEKDVSKVLEWKDSLESNLKEVKNRMDNLEKNFESLHKAIIGKIGDYDKNILEVGSQLKAMEQVFSKVLPTFTDNVSELSRITENLKRH